MFMYDRNVNPEFQKATKLLKAARLAAAAGDHLKAEILYQDAITAFSNTSTHSKEYVAALIGLAESIDARGGDSTGLRTLAEVMDDDK